MPRGRKKTTSYQDQITELEHAIAALRTELNSKEAALKELKAKHVQEEMTRLYDELQARHLQVDDVLALLDDTKKGHCDIAS